MEKHYYRVLTIAGSDSSGGAGIQADLKTFSALGCYGMSVITAITAQNTMGVKAIFPLSVDLIRDQADAVLSDIGTDAIKIGMLFSTDIVDVVRKILLDYQLKNVVFDPVMVSVNKDLLIERDTAQKIISEIFPLVDIITPNIYETEVILNLNINNLDDMINSARKLIDMGCKAVLIKGGRICDDVCYDVFHSFNQDKPLVFSKKSIKTKNVHGTGCTLSSAVASYLALGYQLAVAVNMALEYTYKAIESGSNAILGRGRGPVNHFYNPVSTKFKNKN